MQKGIQWRLVDGWFTEINEQWPGIALSLKVRKVLHEGRTKYQKLEIVETETFGRMMILDDAIQITERDEFAYQEMISHIPLFGHPHPRRVLVIGGGDGGVLREVARHQTVEQIDICEIDGGVIEMSQQWLPYAAVGFKDPRVKVHVEDGAAFVKDKENLYDVVIIDSSDPEGPAHVLFDEPFYRDLFQALTPDGIACSQCESLWLHGDLIKRIMTMSRRIFPSVQYAFTTIPTYPSGQIGFMLSSKRGDCSKPARPMAGDSFDELRYYTQEIHSASFVVPRFARSITEA